jgi:DNA-binding XRE family transcriptional regulator
LDVRFLRIAIAVTISSPGSSEGMSALPRYSNFARYLRNARTKRGLSAVEVADLVGVSSVSIYLWETDHCRPRDRNLAALCRVLKLPIRATRAMAAG